MHIKIIKNLFFYILPFAFISNGFAIEENASPGINNHYDGAMYDDWVGTFESSGREVYDEKERIIEALDLKLGQNIADIGAGTGLHTILFAQKVGKQGLVYAVDITSDFVKNIEKRAKQLGLNNVVGHINNQKEIGLKEKSIDLAFMSNTYHHFEYPISTLKSIYTALKPGGKLVIVDFKKQLGLSSSWVMGHVRASKQDVINEVEANGFKLEKDHKFLRQNYFISFIKN